MASLRRAVVGNGTILAVKVPGAGFAASMGASRTIEITTGRDHHPAAGKRGWPPGDCPPILRSLFHVAQPR
jgi:hypothetical protein